jgi:hypothetical protein
MQYIDITLPDTVAEALFPCTGEEGTGVYPHLRAVAIAYGVLGTQAGVVWHTPDVFSVRYGSSYVATATVGNTSLRFHSSEGDFREGDDCKL